MCFGRGQPPTSASVCPCSTSSRAISVATPATDTGTVRCDCLMPTTGRRASTSFGCYWRSRRMGRGSIRPGWVRHPTRRPKIAASPAWRPITHCSVTLPPATSRPSPTPTSMPEHTAPWRLTRRCCGRGRWSAWAVTGTRRRPGSRCRGGHRWSTASPKPRRTRCGPAASTTSRGSIGAGPPRSRPMSRSTHLWRTNSSSTRLSFSLTSSRSAGCCAAAAPCSWTQNRRAASTTTRRSVPPCVSGHWSLNCGPPCCKARGAASSYLLSRSINRSRTSAARPWRRMRTACCSTPTATSFRSCGRCGTTPTTRMRCAPPGTSCIRCTSSRAAAQATASPARCGSTTSAIARPMTPQANRRCHRSTC